MNFQIEFAYTPDDYWEFSRAYMIHRKSLTPAKQRGLGSPMLMVWFLAAVMVVFVYTIPWDWFSPPASPPSPATAPVPLPTWNGFFLSLIPFVMMLSMIIGLLVFVRRSKFMYRRIGAEILRIGEPRTVEIADTQLTIREAGAVTQAEWKYYMRFIEMPHIFVLFITPRMGHILPKRAFKSCEELREFRAHAQAHISNQPVGFPVTSAQG